MSSSTSGDDRTGTVLGVCTFMLVLSTVTLTLRFWSRHISTKASAGWDDWLALSSFPFIVGINGLTIYWTTLGLGRHIHDAPAPLPQNLLMLFCANFIYNTGLTLIKLSVVLFYARVMRRARGFSVALWVTGGLILAWCITFNLFSALACFPVEKNWEPELPGHCVPEISGMIGATTTNVVIDVLILLLPLPALWSLQLRTARKVTLLGVFISGYCVAIISIVRVVTIVQLGRNLELDFTWNFTNAEIMVCVEMGIALWSSSLPSVYQLCRHWFGNSADPSKGLSGQGSGIRMGALANPIDPRAHKGFTELPVAGLHTNKSSGSSEGLVEEGLYETGVSVHDRHNYARSNDYPGRIQVQRDVMVRNERH